jgi:hypothetical protein
VTFPSTITDEMQPGMGHERGEALHEFERFHHDMGGAVVVGAFELQHHLALGVGGRKWDSGWLLEEAAKGGFEKGNLLRRSASAPEDQSPSLRKFPAAPGLANSFQLQKIGLDDIDDLLPAHGEE